MLENLTRRAMLRITGAVVAAAAIPAVPAILQPPVPVQSIEDIIAAPPLTIVFYSKDGIRVGETAVVRADAHAIVQHGVVQIFATAPFSMIASKVGLEREGQELLTLNESYNLVSGMTFNLRIEFSTA